MSPSHQSYGVVPGWLPFYALIAVALALFAWRAVFLVRVMLAGRPANRWDKVPARVLSVVVNVFGQARLIRGDFWPGLMHATLFWFFCILRMGTIELFCKVAAESVFLTFRLHAAVYLIRAVS